MFKSKNELERITLAPIGLRLDVDSDFKRLVKDHIIKSNTVLKKGREFACKVFGHIIVFEVVEISPEKGVIGKNTVVKIMDKPTAVRKIVKCYRVKPDNQLIVGVGETIVNYDTAWRVEDGKQVPDYLVVWTICERVEDEKD